jgi:NAD(P)-dependent dehydrogenase (short-subunit alcohol dehydrogenase family)/acyl carrier protein
MSEGHLGLIARSQELRAILKSPPGRRRQIIVRPGTAFVKEDSGSYRVNPANKQDYQWLLEDLTREDQLPGQILHLWSLTADTDPPETPGEDPGFAWVDRTQERGLFSLFYLAQAMGAAGMADPLNLHVISAGLQSVWGEELRNPAKSTLLSAIKVIPREFAHITCRSIDVVLPAPGSRQEEQLLRQLRQELEMTEPEIAYRGQQRLVRHFEPLRLPRPPAGETLLKENGVYLVTGGLGGIGLELSQFIAEQVKPRLILTGRSPFPPAAEWDRWLETHDETDPVSVKIGKIRCLEELGADVRVFQADLADDRAMQAVIRQVQEQYGGIRGVIHASGIPGGGAMLRQSRERLEEVLAAKVKGTLILQQLLENEALDFMICCSSASSLLPEFGELAYAAANLFLDAFAHYNHTVNGRFTVSINWGRWRGRGFSVKIEEEHRKRTGQEMSGGMTPGEGKQAFHRILENRIPQLVVLESDFLRQVKAYGQPPPSGEPGPRKPPATPGAKRPRLKTPYVAPQTRMEQQLASLFQQFFGYDRVGIDDDFFDLGGDSLKATVLVTNIHRELNIKIPLATLFLSPTIRELAASGRDLKKERFNTIEAVEKREYYPLSSAQKRLYFLEQFENLGTSYNVPLIIKIQSQPDLGEFERIMGSLIRRHETLRTSFVIIDGDPMQVVFDKVDFILEHLPVKEKKITMEVVQAKIRAFIRRFDLARAPLMRVGIALLSKHEYLLLFDVHHIIADGTSMEFLIDEFTKLSTGKGLPPLKLQYKDFSQWQNRLFESGGIKSQEKFWLEMYADLKEIPRLKLPADYPRSRTLSFAGDHWEFSLSAEETGIFKAVTAQWDVTYYMNLLAVFYVLLYKYTGQEDIVVGGGIMGRSHAELARVFGFFVNALALRNRPRGDKTFAGFLEEVKQTAINAFDNQDFQFEDLVDRLGLQRDPSRNPLFDVLFVFQNFEKAEATQDFLKAESSRISSIPFENRSAKFDLHLIADMIGERLYLAFEYSTTLFKQSTIREMAENFKEIFRQVMENPSVRLKEIKTVNPLLAAKPALSREEGDFEF